MADYIFRVPSPNLIDCQRTSTAGDSTTQFDQWLWPLQALSNTPSKKRGMNWVDEMHLRARAVNWAVRICISLQLPQLIIATAAAYIHRFYMRKPIQKYSPKVMSATALFLATKVEEVPRKLEYVVREYLKIDEDGNEQTSLIAEDSDEFQLLKQQILYYEDILLRTLCFDLAVDHPYVPLVNHVRTIHAAHSSSRSPNSSVSLELADRAKAKSITQAAWGFVNDSLMTPLCLIAKPELIAASAFLLAASHRRSECPPPSGDDDQSDSNHKFNLDRYLNLPTSDHTTEPWWKVFGIQNEEEIYQVANTMLDQYDLSVCNYIRESAAKIARFPGSSLLYPPDSVQNVKTGSNSQINSNDPPPNITKEYHQRATFQDVDNSDVPTSEITVPKEIRLRDEGSASDVAYQQLPPQDATQDGERNPDGLVNLPVSEALRSKESQKSTLQSPITSGGEERTRRPQHSTPVRNAMSDNMDLGTSVGSNSNSSPTKSPHASPSDLDQLNKYPSTDPEKTPIIPKKRSRSRENSNVDLHPPKTPKLERSPKAAIETFPHKPPSSSDFAQPLAQSSSSPLTEKKHVHQSKRDSESSLSDMEDGELD